MIPSGAAAALRSPPREAALQYSFRVCARPHRLTSRLSALAFSGRAWPETRSASPSDLRGLSPWLKPDRKRSSWNHTPTITETSLPPPLRGRKRLWLPALVALLAFSSCLISLPPNRGCSIQTAWRRPRWVPKTPGTAEPSRTVALFHWRQPREGETSVHSATTGGSFGSGSGRSSGGTRSAFEEGFESGSAGLGFEFGDMVKMPVLPSWPICDAYRA